MNQTRRQTPRRLQRSLLSVALTSCLLFGAPIAFAQSTGATLRGQAGADAKVTATNTATGFTRTVSAGGSGGYTLPGLPPGTYHVSVESGGQTTSRDITLRVGETVTLDAADVAGQSSASGNELDTVKVVGTVLTETKTSEVASYVSNRQIEALPQASRNFLAYADIVPGVQFVKNNNGETQLRSGAQSANNINVFIDGVGQKNYVLQGGVTGQDSSSGNPFPQLAVGEFKVITQNYKAEFDQVSSAAIVAQTRSGTNDFDGSFFWDMTRTPWRKRNVFEERDDNKAESGEQQYGVSLGGPIIRDVAHFFVTYESKEFDRPRTVVPGAGISASALPAQFQSAVGAVSVPFDEDLYFGKVDWAIGENHYFEFSARRRSESEVTSVGGIETYAHGADKSNIETRYDLRYQLTMGNWLNDAHLTHEDSFFSPKPLRFENGYVLTRVNPGNPNDNQEILMAGGGRNFQNKGQKGWSLQDDLTFTGLASHTFKMGVKYKAVELETTEQNAYNPQFYYDINDNLSQPWRVEFGTGIPGVAAGSVSSKNKQFGIYFQDDWDVNDKLTLNLGLRWDYEKNPAYTDYVTPASVVAALNAIDPRGNGTQTYAQSLALGGIDINDYISNGHNRSDNKGQWQPRVGFSYDLNGDERHVFFGGAGRSYDRNLFDWMQLETTKATFPTTTFHFNSALHPCTVGVGDCLAWNSSYLDPATLRALATVSGNGREIDMLNNDLKTPYSDQFSIGMRNAFDLWGQGWTSSVTLSRIESHDGFAYLLGNRLPSGAFFAPGTTWGAPWGAGVPGYGALILGTNGIETRSNALLVSIEKPFTRESRWGATLAYTYTDAKENRQFGEHYALDYPTLDGFGWKKAGGVSPHRLVMTGIYQPWDDFTFSAKLTLASQAPRYGVNCYDAPSWNDCGFDQYEPSGTLGEKYFDISAEKQWDTGTDLKLRLRADIFNLFNWTNYTGYDDWWGGPGSANPTFGKPNSASYRTRELKMTVGLIW